jgi:hypothetical protein
MQKALVAGLFVFCGLALGCNGPVPAPELGPDIGPGKAFTYQRPKGWKGSGQIEVGGNAGSIELTSGTALVRIGADLAGSLMADMTTASNNQMGGLADALPGGMGAAVRAANKPAIERLHEAQAQTVGKKFEEFNDGKMQTLQSSLGEGRFSEFTGKDGGREMHGYRVTILGGDKRYSVRAQCAESDWNTLKPVYEKIIQSIGPGPQN